MIMTEIIRVLYAGKLLTRVYNKPTSGRRIINTALHGTWLGVIEESGNGCVNAVTAGPDGWDIVPK